METNEKPLVLEWLVNNQNYIRDLLKFSHDLKEDIKKTSPLLEDDIEEDFFRHARNIIAWQASKDLAIDPETIYIVLESDIILKEYLSDGTD